MNNLRNPTLFEKVILVIGLFVMIIGFVMIKHLADTGGLNSNLLSVVFLWLILIMSIILVAVGEDVKEELRLIVLNQLQETRLLREEVQLLREGLAPRTKKRKK